MGDEAFERALDALSQKERTTAELEALLAKRGFDAEQIGAAIDRLAAIGELDDARFARRYAEDKRELRGWGPARIREALAARGIDSELIDAALAEEPHDDQLARAVELLEARADGLDTDSERARALSYLTRRGYDYELAYEAIRRCAGAAAA